MSSIKISRFLILLNCAKGEISTHFMANEMKRFYIHSSGKSNDSLLLQSAREFLILSQFIFHAWYPSYPRFLKLSFQCSVDSVHLSFMFQIYFAKIMESFLFMKFNLGSGLPHKIFWNQTGGFGCKYVFKASDNLEDDVPEAIASYRQ